jgi:hypothetical protein
MGAGSKGEAVLTIPQHSIQTLLWNVPTVLGPQGAVSGGRNHRDFYAR